MACGCKSGDKYDIELLNVIQHSQEIFSFIFKSDDIKTWQEGDNAIFFMDETQENMFKRLSFASSSNEGHLRMTTRIVKECSPFKKALLGLIQGDKMKITAPKAGLRYRRDDSPVVMLSNGVGIAVTRSFMNVFKRDSRGIPSFCQLNIDSSDEIFKEEFFDAEKKNKHVRSLYVHSRKDYYDVLKNDIYQWIHQEYGSPSFYIVGSDDFVVDSMNFLLEDGVKEKQIIVEKHILGGGCGSGCGCGEKKTSQVLLDFSFHDSLLSLERLHQGMLTLNRTKC
jgi:ferredoxin-NADP reductase